MLAAVREPVALADKAVVVTASIGACVYPLDGIDAELLLRRANTAMHRAKASGKDNVQFYASTRDAAVAERMELETELRHAIGAGELVVHYQPKLDIASKRFIGAEALVRWQHPVRGLLPPGRFVPIAEDSALIVTLGGYVLRQACLQARLWHGSGLTGRSVAVNVAARQLRDGRIVEAVREVLRETGLPAACLELEITESSIMHDLGHATALLHELKALGAAAVAVALISFARTLGMRVNAEGVETRGQANFLTRHGCDEIQGFLLAKPVRADQVEALFRRPPAAIWEPLAT